MKPLQLFRCAIYSSAALLLAACGGNGNDDHDPGDGVPKIPNSALTLAGKSDVQREVGNFIDVYNAFFGVELDDAVAPTSALKSARLQLAQRETVVPKVATTTNCELGGTITEDSGTVPREFTYFDANISVGFESASHDGCTEDDGDDDGTYTEVNGYEEQGGGVGGELFYSYNQLGEGDEYLTEVERVDGRSDDFDYQAILGLFETVSTASSAETRHVFNLRFEEEEEEGEHTAGQITQGEEGEPFVTSVTSAGVSVSGPYAYATDDCAGGHGEINTNTPVAFDEDGFPIGGAITVTSGTTSATVTFVGDGSATYQFNSGATGTLTRAELEASVDGC